MPYEEANRLRGKRLPSPVIPLDTVCITIEVPNAQEYLAAFFGQLDILGDWHTWEHMTDGTTCEDCEIAAQLWRTALFEAKEMAKNSCGCGTGVPSITEILNTNTYTNTTNNEYITNNTTYEADSETLTTLAPNMTYAVGVEADIDRMLCFGYRMMLDTIIRQGKGIKQIEAGQEQDIVQQIGIAMGGLAAAGGIAIGVGGGAAAVVAIIGGPWALLGLAIGGVAVGIGSLFIQADTAIFDDAAALAEVLCTMNENSLGNEPTFDVFSGLLTPNGFAPDSNAEKLAALVQPFLDSLDFYLQFMISMSELYATPLLIALPECEVCPEPPEDCDAINTTTTLGWAPDASDYGVMTATGMAGTLYVPDGLYYFRWFLTANTLGAGITSVKLKFNQPKANVTLYRGGTASTQIMGSIGATASDELICDATTHHASVPYPFDNNVSWFLRVTGDTVPSTFRVNAMCLLP